MASIKSKNTIPELIVRKYLFSKGFRFRLHRKDLPGKPDIVLPKYKTAIFVHGCFWHQHKNCKRGIIPKSNLNYWIPKLENNLKRDEIHSNELKLRGWNVIVIWECETKKLDILETKLKITERYG